MHHAGQTGRNQLVDAGQIAFAACDFGNRVDYEGIRLSPARIAYAALEEVLRRMRHLGVGEIPVVVGGIIPPDDERELPAAGACRVHSPKDDEIQDIMSDLVGIAVGHQRAVRRGSWGEAVQPWGADYP